MSSGIFFAILLAAFIHAFWNTLLKSCSDEFSAILAMSLVSGIVALPILPFITSPEKESWPWIVAAAMLHTGYKIFLAKAYKIADLSQVYPLARGAAPIIIAIVLLTFFNETIVVTNLIAIVVISLGMLLMAFKGGNFVSGLEPMALVFAMVTAGIIAGYSIVDGIGARIAGTASGFILWMSIGDAIGMIIYAKLFHGNSVFRKLRGDWKTGSTAGILALISYWIAVWAFTQAPISLVAALRETSIIFAVLIAFFVLKEPISIWRWVSVLIITMGATITKL